MSREIKRVAEIDLAELTVRLLEIGCKIKRPAGMSGVDALDQIKATGPADIIADFDAMARASIEYVIQQINDAVDIQ